MLVEETRVAKNSQEALALQVEAMRREREDTRRVREEMQRETEELQEVAFSSLHLQARYTCLALT